MKARSAKETKMKNQSTAVEQIDFNKLRRDLQTLWKADKTTTESPSPVSAGPRRNT
jgi:hypothetical protein